MFTVSVDGLTFTLTASGTYAFLLDGVVEYDADAKGQVTFYQSWCGAHGWHCDVAGQPDDSADCVT